MDKKIVMLNRLLSFVKILGISLYSYVYSKKQKTKKKTVCSNSPASNRTYASWIKVDLTTVATDFFFGIMYTFK